MGRSYMLSDADKTRLNSIKFDLFVSQHDNAPFRVMIAINQCHSVRWETASARARRHPSIC